MLNKLMSFIRRYDLVQPGDHIVCAVSGGADSVALLFSLYLLREKLQIQISAAHFNHGLRGEESDRDEAFVRAFCKRFGISIFVGSQQVVAGKKGLEAAAREARYAYLCTLPGKIATAHTANDNAETLLMHLIRGTGLKGLGAISPINGPVIRPMLDITRRDVLAFLQEYHLDYVTDSSNDTDLFLRNRLRHHVMPLLEKENPKLCENMSALALRLQEDERLIAGLVEMEVLPPVSRLREMDLALRSRYICAFLHKCGVAEPEAEHIAVVEKMIRSKKPSAKADFPGGITICRNYDRLQMAEPAVQLQDMVLPCPGEAAVPNLGLRVVCRMVEELGDLPDVFTVSPVGTVTLRCRKAGDMMRLPGGTKELRKIYIDRKIPATIRSGIPVIADDLGVLGVYGIGVNIDRKAKVFPAVEIRFIKD